MTQENPIEETPTPETDADKIARLESELVGAHEIIASKNTAIAEAAKRESALSASLAEANERYRVLAEEVVPNERAKADKIIAGLTAQVAEYEQIADSVMNTMFGNTKIKQTGQQKALGLMLSDPKIRGLAKGMIAAIEAE